MYVVANEYVNHANFHRHLKQPMKEAIIERVSGKSDIKTNARVGYIMHST